MPDSNDPLDTTAARLKNLVLGKPKELKDPTIFHRISLVAFLAWVGLGADGLSSSAYGPEEAYKALLNDSHGSQVYLAALLAVATAITVFVISWSYSRIIEAFPTGGGGYVVSYKLLGPTIGALSGSALLIDYVLTISISIASGVDAVFSSVPPGYHWMKLIVAAVMIALLTLLNLRGVKESVTVLAPMFLLFLVTHAILLTMGIGQNANHLGEVVHNTREGFSTGYSTLGFFALAAIFFRAYSLGGGTYTGIEAVANGMKIMREPVIQTAKKTMAYMATSLAITAGGIIFCYLLTDAHPLLVPGHDGVMVQVQTMNATLAHRIADSWHLGSIPVGHWFIYATLASEAALLFVAAQAGFIDGPRVMANMAVDSWLPHRFAALSDRLSMQNGILLMSVAALAALWYTGGRVDKLAVLYSINVFMTFSLSNIAMATRAWRSRSVSGGWWKNFSVHVFACILCLSILTITVTEKFLEGGWVTLGLTGGLLGLCILIRRHYVQVRFRLRRLEIALADLPPSEHKAPAVDPLQPTAVLLVAAYGGLGVHSLLSIFRFFPNYFKNVVFVSIGVIDSGNFKGAEEMDRLQTQTTRTVQKYVDLASRLGVAAEGVTRVGTDPVDEAEKVCDELALKYPKHMFFGGKLVFRKERWFERILHNETAFAIQRRLQWKGHPMTVLPVRVLE